MDQQFPSTDLNLPLALATVNLQAFRQVPSPLLVIDGEPGIVWMNDAARSACSPHQLSEILASDEFSHIVREALAGGKQSAFEDTNGYLRLQTLAKLGHEYLLCGVEDLQTRYRRDEEYRRLQKSGSLFLFSQGLGHDLKDRLTGVVGNLNLARVMLEDARPGQEALESIRDAERAALDADALVQQFMLFSHNDNETRQILDLNALVGNAAALTLGGSSRRMQISLREPVWKLSGNPGQIQQVFQNVLQNAAEAMLGPGTIHVDMENLRIQAAPDGQDQEEGSVRDGQFGPGDYVVVHVRDSGDGILSRDLPFIFEPFFSRKELRQGLGLTVALSIVRKHAGFMDVYSHAGRGTTVSIYLPVSGSAESVPHPMSIFKPAKILVMDDESLVRSVWERMLGRLGHKGSFVAEGAEAIYLYQIALNSDHPFDMVILDLTVPGGMGALETLEGLKSLDAQVRAVICSGYTQDPLMMRFPEYGFKAALAKPFGLDAMQRLVQDVLG